MPKYFLIIISFFLFITSTVQGEDVSADKKIVLQGLMNQFY